ncbi:enolase C-terminal domain-like protein, partial [Escherichia coli]|uniref:enolase C-terminal domain-like protein n=1 Tax=Escherichia coli TaxID=562 RepID=UPI0023EEBA4F
GTAAGAVVFDPEQVRPSVRRAPLVIERVEVRRNEQVLDMTHDAPLQIADGDRDLRIVARLLSFADSASNTYRYRLAGYDPDWVEVGPAGERLFSRWDFKRVLADGYVDIIQPDPSHAGGITETRKIAAMAEAYDVALALHCPLGPIALATCLQIDAGCYNAFIQEQSLGIHYNAANDLLDYVSNREVFAY